MNSGLNLDSLMVESEKSIIEIRGKKFLNLIDVQLNTRPTRISLAPLRNVRNALRWPDDFIINEFRYDGYGLLDHRINLLRIPDTKKVA